MPALQFTMLASMYGKHYKLNKGVRTITTTTTISSHASIAKSIYSLPLNSHQRKVPMAWRIIPCAPLGTPAHDKLLYRRLGFRGKKYFFPPQDEGGVFGGKRGGSAVTTSMGSENNHQKPTPQKQHQSAKLLTLPTILTIGRVAAVPLLVSSFYVNSWWGPTVTTGIFIVAAITDWLDGYIARKMKLGSAFGAFLDPVADKLMVAATLVLLCTRPLEVAMFGQVSWLLAVPSIVIIGREITMSAVREWAASQNSKVSEAVAVNNLGKWKTATQMTALIILLASRDSSLTCAGILAASGVPLLYISAWLAVWSLVVYMRKIWKVLLM